MLASISRPLRPWACVSFSTATAAHHQIMQNTKDEWKQMTKTSGRVYFGDYENAVDIVKNLGYGDYYKNGSIADLYPGNCVFSAALYNTLQPKKYCMMDPSRSYFKVAQHLSEGLEGVTAIGQDPFRWDVMRVAMSTGALDVRNQPWDQVNDSLLLFANLTNSQSKQLVAQYLSVMGRKSWIFKHGRIRLLLLLDVSVAERLMADVGTLHRRRLSATREFFADAKVIFWEPRATTPKGQPKGIPSAFTPDLLPKTDKWYAPVRDKYHKTRKVALVELTPKNINVEHVEQFEHVIKHLMITTHVPLRKTLESLGPGAFDGMKDRLEGILDLHARDLNSEQWQMVANAYELWPFRPQHMMDFYEDDYSVNSTKINSQIREDVLQAKGTGLSEDDPHHELDMDEALAPSA